MTLLQTVRGYAKDKRFFIPVGGALLLVVIALAFLRGRTDSMLTAEVRRGPFLVSIKNSGEIRAANSFMLTTPRLTYGQMQINFLLPEGATVRQGDVIIRFATSAIDKTIQDKESELEILQSEFAKFRADRVVRVSELEGSLRNAELSYEQSKLQVEKMKFEAEIQRKEGEISLERSRIAFQQAKQKSESQKVAEELEERKLLLKVQQTQNDLNRARQEKEQYALKATMDGLVVYETNWQSGRKISVGDSPWPGMPLVSLPDLSRMNSICQINEVDVSKVKSGQSVTVRLDAFPDREFTGAVKSVAAIGRQGDRERPSTIKTFEVVIDINGTDPVLKPGMTTSNEIVVAALADTLSVPLEAVFEKDGKTVVYEMLGSTPSPVEVTIGMKNADNVVVASGLHAGDRVTLRDPTLKKPQMEQQQGAGRGVKL